MEQNVAEDAKLAEFGYEQGTPNCSSGPRSVMLTNAELKRSFSLLGMIGFSFSIVTRFDGPTPSDHVRTLIDVLGTAGVHWPVY